MQTIREQPARPNHATVLAVLTGVLIVLCAVVAFPFLSGITWGVAFAIIAWPVHRWLRRHLWPTVAAIISSATIVLVILVPSILVTMRLAQEATAAASKLQEATQEVGVREKLTEVPGVASAMAWMDKINIDAEEEARKLVDSSVRDLKGLAQGSIAAIIQFLVAIFILFYLLRDHDELKESVRGMLPLSRNESEQVFGRAADAVHATIYSTIVTSALDGLGGGLVFWAVGMPSPVLWGVAMFVLAVLPVVGAALVWVPAAAYLAMTDRWLGCLAIVGWGLASWVLIDNLFRVRLAGARMRMHDVPALIAILGGLAVFGVAGMILGPAIVAVTIAVLEVWKRRMFETETVNGHPKSTTLDLSMMSPTVDDVGVSPN